MAYENGVDPVCHCFHYSECQARLASKSSICYLLFKTGHIITEKILCLVGLYLILGDFCLPHSRYKTGMIKHDLPAIHNLTKEHSQGRRKRGDFLKIKRALLCLLQNLGGMCPPMSPGSYTSDHSLLSPLRFPVVLSNFQGFLQNPSWK